MSNKRTPYDGSDPWEAAAGLWLLLWVLSLLAVAAVTGALQWAAWELFGPWGIWG